MKFIGATEIDYHLHLTIYAVYHILLHNISYTTKGIYSKTVVQSIQTLLLRLLYGRVGNEKNEAGCGTRPVVALVVARDRTMDFWQKIKGQIRDK